MAPTPKSCAPVAATPMASTAPMLPTRPSRPCALPEQAALPVLSSEEIEALSEEVRALAMKRNATILAHNYQVPEIQDVADYVGDSLGLSRRAAAGDSEVIAFCGVHFMAETASILCPQKTVLIPDLDAGCSLAASIDAEQLAAWRAEYPDGVVVMYVNTTAEVKALTDYCCTSANAVDVVRHIYETNGPDTEILFGPDMWLGAFVEKELGRPMHVWDGECHVHAGIRPADIESMRAEHPGAEFLIHPECGCTTSVMEYVAAGDISGEGVHMLSTGGMLRYAEELERVAGGASSTTTTSTTNDDGPSDGPPRAGASGPGRAVAGDVDGTAGGSHERPGSSRSEAGRREVVVATETGMLYPLEMAAPDVSFIPANPRASCMYMKMITLPKLRDALRDMKFEVCVPEEIAVKARVPIDRMVALG
jgi:quinolinate synthase